MRVRWGVVLVLMSIVVVVSAPRVAVAAGPCDTVHRSASTDGKAIDYRIDRPVVNQPSTEYRCVSFKPGDAVTIRGGGCVQTGGSGRTWKRYVNPSGPDSDRLYYGTIWIPGVMGKLEVLKTYQGKTVVVPSNLPANQPLFLRLGYIDDEYDDNGYNDHDDGTENQCRGVGPAFVTLQIRRGGNVAPSGGTGVTHLPLDLVWDFVDANFIPLNPQWQWQVTHPQHSSFDTEHVIDAPQICPTLQSNASSCTTQGVTYDSALTCVDNTHVNWMPATYIGKIRWSSHSTDDDYNVRIATPNENGSTLADLESEVQFGDAAIESEFDSDETIDNFSTPWWNQFHSAVDNDDNKAHQMMDGKTAIISGLFGLDCQHGCKAEPHPVWTMAIHANDIMSDDTWVFFSRNWGNEGWCSGDTHVPDIATVNGRYVYKVVIPWRLGASSVRFLPSTVFHTNNSTVRVGFQIAKNQAIQVNFVLPQPGAYPLVDGELHLQWITGSSAPAMHSLAVTPPSAPVGSNQPAKKTITAEEDLKLQLGKLNPSARTAVLADLNRIKAQRKARVRTLIRPTTIAVPLSAPEEVPTLRTSVPAAQARNIAKSHAIRDVARQQENAAMAEVLRKAGIRPGAGVPK